jgi:membrane-bound lytic murein transglycosylase D
MLLKAPFLTIGLCKAALFKSISTKIALFLVISTGLVRLAHPKKTLLTVTHFMRLFYKLFSVLSFTPTSTVTPFIACGAKPIKTHSLTVIGIVASGLLLGACDGTFPVKGTLLDGDSSPQEGSIATGSPHQGNNDTHTHETANNNQADNLWAHIRKGYQLNSDIPTIGEQRINDLINRYRKHPKDIRQQTEQASPYLHHIVSELEKNNMPTELALLPFVESRFDPFAYSSGRASGLWQFIPVTGDRFKMKQTWWHDERRDVIKSTQAAIDYLQYLHRFFDNDWLLAIAAYNAGEGTVKRAIKRNRKAGKATDYWSLPLPKQTQFYLPKLFAWARIVNTPTHYALALAPIADTPVFTSIDVQSQIDLATFSDISGMDIKQVYALNPAYNRWATDPQAPHHLLVPVAKADDILAALQSHPVKNRMQWQRYTIKPNDALSLIATRFNTDTSSIKKANQLTSSRIRVGQTLLIPKPSKQAPFYQKSASQRLALRQRTSQKKNRTKVEYVTQSGDTLWGIAKIYKVKPSAIAYWNNMAERDVLKNKQTLVIWQDNSALTSLTDKRPSTHNAEEKRKVLYTVRSGDNLSYIAQRFSVTTKDIRKWNAPQIKKYIKPGQVLRLFVTVANRSL